MSKYQQTNMQWSTLAYFTPIYTRRELTSQSFLCAINFYKLETTIQIDYACQPWQMHQLRIGIEYTCKTFKW